MDIKKLIVACAAIFLLCSGDASAVARNHREKAPNFRESLAASKANDPELTASRASDPEGKAPVKKRSQNAARNAKVKAMTLLSRMKFSELNDFPSDFLSGGEVETFEDVGSEFGKHIQDVWNLPSDSVVGSNEIRVLLDDLAYTATANSLNGKNSKGAIDAKFDFSKVDEMDFQEIINRYDGSKAFYLNAIAKIAHVLNQGTKGHVFWHGMFKIMVNLLVAYHYVPYLRNQ